MKHFLCGASPCLPPQTRSLLSEVCMSPPDSQYAWNKSSHLLRSCCVIGRIFTDIFCSISFLNARIHQNSISHKALKPTLVQPAAFGSSGLVTVVGTYAARRCLRMFPPPRTAHCSHSSGQSTPWRSFAEADLRCILEIYAFAD